MRVTISRSKSAEQVYITKAYRDETGKSTSKIIKKLGSMASLLPEHDNDREKVLAWARELAEEYTRAEKNNTLKLSIDLSEDKQISFNEIRTCDGGYLFLQRIFYELGLDDICKDICKDHGFEYDLSQILACLIYERILSPSSKLSSFFSMQHMLKKPSFKLHDLYRALDVLDEESDLIQSILYKRNRAKRNTSVLYYDCTNFFFEIEEESEIRKYGRSKEHRPNPIVQMGLFMDGDGIPLAFSIFPGNESEQPTLIPLEKTLLSDFAMSKFIVCTDAGLSSYVNRKFNDRADRAYVVTQSLKTLKSHIKEWALSPYGFRLKGDEREYDITQIDENIHFNDIFYKERWINENGLEQRLVVTYSPKHRHYQSQIRSRQVERAAKILQSGKRNCTHNPNSPDRFIEEMQITIDGQIAEKTVMSLDAEKIAEESRYDGYYCVSTNLEGSVRDILRINRGRWEIEESFRMMKSEFQARPVYLQKDSRIRAHFMTCFLSLIVFRTLEKKLDSRFTSGEILRTLREMKFQKVKGIGYMPGYTRTEITDALHEVFGFHTDREIITEENMKKILRETKK